MKRAAFVLAIALVLVSCATMEPRGQALVSRAVQAMGGTDALAGVKTLSMKGTVRQWEPEQSMTAGGEMRFACESVFEAVTDVGSGATRIDWSRKFAYPAPRSFTFTEVVTRNPDLAARDLSRTPIVKVAERHVITDGQREVHAYRIDNPHADGLLIGYVPEARLGFATDIWSPGAGPLPDKLNPGMAALVAGVKKAGISPARFAGGHGSVADYAPLAALEGR